MTGAPANLDVYASQFDELQVEERTTVISLNAVNELSTLREDWQNAQTTPSEHQLSTSANTNDTAYLETEAHGQYNAGFQVQAGTGIRIPNQPTGDTVIRWGYYDVDSNGDPVNGFYFGYDSDGLFVARARSGTVDRKYRSKGEWNGDPLNGSGSSGVDLDLSDGIVSQTEFVYYGYGSIEMQFLVSDDQGRLRESSNIVVGHTFDPIGETSIENTNLPLRQEIDSDGTNNDALDLYIGGRQFSILGERVQESRTTGHYLDTVSAVDDTKWHAAISFKLKDGTDIGSIDFRHVLGEIEGFSVDTDQNAYRWQIRRGTAPNSPTWENPTSAEDNQSETALKADTSSNDIQDASGNLTGVMLDGGTLASGGNNDQQVRDITASGEIVGDQIITLVFKAVPGASGAVSNVYFKVSERW